MDFAPSKASQQAVEDGAKLMDKTWETIQKKSNIRINQVSSP